MDLSLLSVERPTRTQEEAYQTIDQIEGCEMQMLRPNWTPKVGMTCQSLNVSTVDTSLQRAHDVTTWIRSCRQLNARRAQNATAWAREQQCVAMGYLAHLILKHWGKAARSCRVWRQIIARCGLSRGWARLLEWLKSSRYLEMLEVRIKFVCRILTGRAFESWRKSTHWLKRNLLLRTTIALLVKHKMFRCFRAWLLALHQLRLLAGALMSVLRRWQRTGALGRAWWRWKRLSVLVSSAKRLVRHFMHSHLSRCWLSWRSLDVGEHSLLRTSSLPDSTSVAVQVAAWHTLAARSGRRPPRKRLGHCACVYGRGCSGDHTRWRLKALRTTINHALLHQAPDYFNFSMAQRPPPTGQHDEMAAWDDARNAMATILRVKTRAHKTERTDDPIIDTCLPTVESMSILALRGVSSDDTRASLYQCKARDAHARDYIASHTNFSSTRWHSMSRW